MNELDFKFTEDNQEMFTTEVLKISNPGNAKALLEQHDVPVTQRRGTANSECTAINPLLHLGPLHDFGGETPRATTF